MGGGHARPHRRGNETQMGPRRGSSAVLETHVDNSSISLLVVAVVRGSVEVRGPAHGARRGGENRRGRTVLPPLGGRDMEPTGGGMARSEAHVGRRLASTDLHGVWAPWVEAATAGWIEQARRRSPPRQGWRLQPIRIWGGGEQQLGVRMG